MNAADPPPDVGRLRRRFVALMIVQGALAVLALAFAVAHFAFHQAWGLPAFAVAIGVALLAQIRFVWMFKNDAR